MLAEIANEERLWLRWLIGAGILPVFLAKFMLGTIPGALLSALLLHACAPRLLGVEPWTAGQLLLWLDELSSEAKVGLITSLVTVLGFFIAVQTTMHVWQRQTAAMMRITATESIDRVTNEIRHLLQRIQLFSEAVAKEVDRVRDCNIPVEAAPLLSVLSEDVATFRQHRERLVVLQQELIYLPAKFATLLLPLAGTAGAFERMEDQLGRVMKLLWVGCPALGPGHPRHRQELVERVDPQKYLELSNACEEAGDKIAALQGALRGALQSTLVEMNAVALARVLRQCFRIRVE